MPSAEYFPFEHLDIKVPTAPGFSPEETKKSGTVLRAGKHDIQEGKSTYGTFQYSLSEMDTTDVLQDLEIALNYGQATGAAPLLRFVTEHTEVGNTKHKILFAHPEQNRLFTAHPTPTGNAL